MSFEYVLHFLGSSVLIKCIGICNQEEEKTCLTNIVVCSFLMKYSMHKILFIFLKKNNKNAAIVFEIKKM